MTAQDAFASLQRHGGHLETARAAFPSVRLPWIDLSTGINPHPWQGARAGKKDWQRLPEPADTAALETAAAATFGCNPDYVAAVPGAEIGLRLLPRLTSANRVAVASPTYGGHAEAWTAAGAAVHAVDRSSLDVCDADTVVVVNPNNPDGAVLKPEKILDIARRQYARKGWLIVDESFADGTPEVSVAAHANDRLIVIRSFGKFYGLAGIRLGFVVAGPGMTAAVRGMTGDWPVSAEAIRTGRAAYADAAWQARTRARLARDAARLDRYLNEGGFDVLGGADLFRLASKVDATADAMESFRHLARAGILVRPFAYAPTWLRFGIPGRFAWSRLKAALKNCP